MDLDDALSDGSQASVDCSDYDDQDVSAESKKTQKERVEALSKRETRVVLTLRILVIAVLLASTGVMAWSVHNYLQTAEQDEFREEFSSAADKVLTSMGGNLDLTLGAIDTMTVSFVSYARDHNQSWPFVTVPDFAVRATKARRLARAIYLTMHHVVSADQRAGWEAYTAANNGWVNESVKLQAADPDYHGVNYFDHYYVDEIVDNCEYAVEDAEIYVPSWQSSPSIPKWSPYNWDALTWSDPTSYLQVMEKKQVLVSESWLLPDTTDEAIMAEHNSTIEWITDYLLDSDQEPDEPIVDIYYPILDTLDTIRVSDSKDEPLVGFIALAVYWRQMLEDTLPQRTQGVVVVVKNPCNPTFTFQVDGPKVHYLGRGDQHNEKYDDMEVTVRLFELSSLQDGTTFYSGLPLDESYCSHQVHVYPSEKFEDNFTSNDPIVFPIIVAAIFLFTSLVFITYDRVVELRQRRLVSKATVSSAIVSSLFPKTVRDQLHKEKEKEIMENKKEAKTNAKKQAFSNLIGMGAADPEQPLASSTSNTIKGRPIANLFPDTTIFFGDLVGFTAWSNKRSPEDVFVLLESIYAAFDAIAESRNVFKVETIGDCYVAITGCPEPQKNHAVTMVRFARDCMFKLNQVANELASELGEDTNQLQLRVGLHSGSTTAGVLRGIKGRFQLFGDTVNTASRMESTSMPGKIQISQATADCLEKRGKSTWFTRRSEEVEAKGKGKMQTYFINMGGGGKSGASPTTIDFSETRASSHGELGASQGTLEDDDDDYADGYLSTDSDDQLKDHLHGYFEKSDRPRNFGSRRVDI